MPVFGTRPEAIKMAPVVQQIASLGADLGLEQVVCVTAQHRQMLDQVLDLFEIRPAYDLGVMAENQTPSRVAAAVLTGLDEILRTERPDWVLVQGDTTTAAAAALAAFYNGSKVGHVEAGLRSFDKWQPFPEEINRKVAGVTADLNFAPTARSRANLLREGVAADSIIVTGNTVIDALGWVNDRLDQHPELEYDSEIGPVLRSIGDKQLVLVTVHRRENIGAPLERICQALADLALRYKPTAQFVIPVHPNPNIRGPVVHALESFDNVTLLSPLDYLPLVALMRRARLVITDSGGIQEEAPTLGIPVLVTRNTTERPEAVEAGTVKLVGANRELIVAETTKLLEDDESHRSMARAVNPYGDGLAAWRIVRSLVGEPVEEFDSAVFHPVVG